jgi:hypothetical protein
MTTGLRRRGSVKITNIRQFEKVSLREQVEVERLMRAHISQARGRWAHPR